MPKIPRFTPDPAPEGLDPPLAEWLQRQLNRIEDWWPKDLEDRLAYLESLFPYLVGVWPIIGQSSVSFEAEIIGASTVCDFTLGPGYDSFAEVATDFTMNRGVSLERDMSYMVAGGSSNESVRIWGNNLDGTWSELPANAPTPPAWHSNGDGFGFSVSHSTSANILIVGSPYSDEVGASRGGATVYTGSNASGWTFSHSLFPTVNQDEQRLGSGVEVCESGEVAAIGCGGSIAGTGSKVYIYDNNNGLYTERNIVPNPSSETAFGNQIALNQDGTVMLVANPTYGVGSTGRVYVYDDVGGVFTLRQTIDPPDYLVEGIPGAQYSPNNDYFGSGLSLSSNGTSLIVIVPNWVESPPGTYPSPLLLSYKLNASTNNYEYCDYSVYTDADNQASSDGNGDIVFVDGVRYFACNVAKNRTGRGRINIFEFT